MALCMYIYSFYRRDVSDEASIDEFETSLMRACAIRNATGVIGGDWKKT